MVCVTVVLLTVETNSSGS